MYLVPVLVGVDAPDPLHPEAIVAADLHPIAVHVDHARRLSPLAAATTRFALTVTADGIELPPAHRPPA